MLGVVLEGEVAAVEVHEEVGEDEDDQYRRAEEADDEEEVGSVGWALFEFHGSWMRGSSERVKSEE